ncbi:MAG: hypothetical protein ACFFCS_00995 [Candidatus Hodarchaeota archaeon]
MQGISHFMTALVITRALYKRVKHPFDKILIIVLSFLSHVLIDGLANYTYHTTNVQHPTAYLTYMIIISILTGIFCLHYFVKYFKSIRDKSIDRTYYALVIWACVFSIGFDIVDWAILRPLGVIGSNGFLHKNIKGPFTREVLWWIPNLSAQPWAMVNEFFTIGVLFTLAYLDKIVIKCKQASMKRGDEKIEKPSE